MAINTQPTYTKKGQDAWQTLTTANTAKDGTGTAPAIFTADATNGGRVNEIRALPLGTNTASVLRVFENNGSSPATPANNTLVYEASLPGTTLTEVAAQTPVVIAVNRQIPPGYKLLVTIGTTVAAGWAVCALGGDYTA